jgi:hypothetical protein
VVRLLTSYQPEVGSSPDGGGSVAGGELAGAPPAEPDVARDVVGVARCPRAAVVAVVAGGAADGGAVVARGSAGGTVVLAS